MASKELFCRYGLIGENLDLKKNIYFTISEDGIFAKIEYEEIKEKEISLKRNSNNLLAIPSFINSHVHIVDNFAKEAGYNRNLLDIVAPPDGLKHRLLRERSKEIKTLSIKNGVEELLSNGVTAFMDFREGGLEGIKLIKNALLGSNILYRIQGRYSNIHEIEEIFKHADGLGLSSYSKVNSKEKDLITKYKQNYKKLVACHDAENKLKPVLFQNIIEDKIVDLIVHGTYYTEEEIIKLEENNISLVLCPRSNAYFGVGFPNLKAILKHKIKVSLGTDNFMALNPNVLEELRYLFFRAREMGLNGKDGLNAKELFRMITINGAKNLKMDDKIGSLTEGKFANYNLIDLNNVNFFTDHLKDKTFFPLLIQRTKPENIKKTIIGGNVIYERKL